MLNYFVRTFRRSAYLALLAIGAASSAQSQTLSPLAYFFLSSPNGSLVADASGNLYGTASPGTGAPGGFIYRVKADASSIDTIYQYGRLNNWTGALPASGLLLDGTTLYGVTTASGYDQLKAFDTRGDGITGYGTIFSVDVSGQNYKKLYEFEPLTFVTPAPPRNLRILVNTSGAYPKAQLTKVVVGGVSYLYGTAYQGGTNGVGVVFRVREDGAGTNAGFEVLANFAEIALKQSVDSTTGAPLFDANGVAVMEPNTNVDSKLINTNGVNPDLPLSFGNDGFVYGATRYGGANGTGVVYRVPLGGGAIQVMHTFDAIVPAVVSTDSNGVVTVVTPAHNSDGAYPSSGPVIAADSNGTRYLYGAASSYGPVGKGGTIYRIALDGSNTFAKVLEFDGTNGANPSGQLIVGAGNVLIGTAANGGAPTSTTVTGTPAGIIFKLPLNDSTSYTSTAVYRFVAEDTPTNGAAPSSGVIETSDGSLYGIAGGGANGAGVIFKYGTAPANGPLGIQPPYDDGGGVIDARWLVALLALLIATYLMRRRRI